MHDEFQNLPPLNSSSVFYTKVTLPWISAAECTVHGPRASFPLKSGFTREPSKTEIYRNDFSFQHYIYIIFFTEEIEINWNAFSQKTSANKKSCSSGGSWPTGGPHSYYKGCWEFILKYFFHIEIKNVNSTCTCVLFRDLSIRSNITSHVWGGGGSCTRCSLRYECLS